MYVKTYCVYYLYINIYIYGMHFKMWWALKKIVDLQQIAVFYIGRIAFAKKLHYRAQ